MKHQIPNNVKTQNKQYTAECQKIWEGLSFAEVKSHGLTTAVIPVVFVCFLIFAVGFLLYYICVAIIHSPDWWCIGFFLFLTALFTTAAAISLRYTVKENKYGKPWFFVRDGQNEFQIWCGDGETTIARTIVNLTKHKVLYVDKNGECSVGTDGDFAVKVTGFYQYLATPDKVYDGKHRSFATRKNQALCYKKKRIKGNKTYYYFPTINNAVGTRYARCIMLENNTLKYICVENADGRSKKIAYNSVNNDSVKIHVPAFVREYAKAQKFPLPAESQNIVYDDTVCNA